MKKVALEYRKPPYAIDSVDNALRALHMLRDAGSVRISDIADNLGVAASTAHRIMAMLVYRGFALQDERHRYLAGPALSAPVITSRHTRTVIETARPILQPLVARIGETVNLAARVGVHTRVLLTIEATTLMHIEDRTGAVLWAHASAGGRALLALESPELLEKLYQGKTAQLNGAGLAGEDFDELVEELEHTRQRGYSVCTEEVNKGFSSIALPVVTPWGPPTALVVSTPPARHLALRADREKLDDIFATRDLLEEALSEALAAPAA